MASGVDYFLKKTLGEDFMESLSKVELWKPGTKSTIDHEELRTALQIVPRTVMALLIKELVPMSISENKTIDLFVSGNAKLEVTKHERDVYSGQILQDNKQVVEFKLRALPGVGLIIMSAFELYDMENLINSPVTKEPLVEDAESKIHKLIDERLALHDLVEKVVEKKMVQKEAIHSMILMKLTEELEKTRAASRAKDRLLEAVIPPVHVPAPMVPVMKSDSPKKGSPVKEFLENRKKKRGEYSIEMAKGETVDCPDCRKNIFDGTLFSGCVCLGDDMQRKVFIKKSEDGIKVRFSRGWDQENIEMLLEVMRKKHE